MYKMEGIGTVFTRQHQNNILSQQQIAQLGVWLNCIHYYILSLVQRFFCKKIQVGNDQEKAQSEKIPTPKTEAGKNKLIIRY